MNLFIATILLTYGEFTKADTRAVDHYQLNEISKLWREFDPYGRGYVNYKEFWTFSSKIALIFGVDSKQLLDIQRKKNFLKLMNVPLFENSSEKIFCYMFHDVIVNMSRLSVIINYGVIE